MRNQSTRSFTSLDASNSQTGVIGDGTIVHGGINFYFNPPHELELNLVGIQNFLRYHLGTDTHPVPFGGRGSDLEYLERWRTESTKNFLLIATPAGRGKSALLTHWSRELSQSETNKNVAVVFIPVSVRFNTNLPELVFPCLASQLACLHEERIPSNYNNLPPAFWQNHVAHYLHRPLPDNRQLLIILDGLDEAAWDIGPDLFPLDLPLSTRIAVSTRYFAGESSGPKSWLGRLGWQDSADDLSLEMLTCDGLREVMEQMGDRFHKLAEQTTLVDKLHRLTVGDPLLVRMYIDWLRDQEEPLIFVQPSDLDKIKPDFSGYFEHWWAGQEKLWEQQGKADVTEKESVITLLYVLATALGPLNVTDLKAVAPEILSSKHKIRKAMQPLRRFALGDGEDVGFSFAHPRLGDYFRQEFLDGQEQMCWSGVFVRWGQETIKDLRDSHEPDYDNVSRYLLQHYSQHLEAYKAPIEMYLQLLSQEWLKSWYRYTGTHVGFLRDVDIVLKKLTLADRKAIIQETTAPHIGEEILCALCHTSINSLANNMPVGLLVNLRRYAGWTDEQVLAYAQLKPDLLKRVEALQKLAPHLSLEKQQQAYDEALQVAQTIPDEWSRIVVLSELAPHLPKAVFKEALAKQDKVYRAAVLVELVRRQSETEHPELLDDALQETNTIQTERHRVFLLSRLAPHLPEAERTEVIQKALQLARDSSQDERFQVFAWGELAPHLPEEVFQDAMAIQNEESRASVLSKLAHCLPNRVFKEATKIQNERYRTMVLGELASYLPTEVFQVVEDIQDDLYRAKVLRRLAPKLPKDVFRVAQEIQNERYKAKVLSKLARHLPELVYEVADSIHMQRHRALVLSDLVPFLPEEERATALGQALQSAQATPGGGGRAKILIELAPYLPEEVMKIALTLDDERHRARVLGRLTPHFSDEKQSSLAYQALQAAQNIQDEWERADVLVEVCSYLPEEVYKLAVAIHDERHQAKVLVGLAPYLPELVLTAAMRMEDKPARAWALGRVAFHLPLPEAERLNVLHQALETLDDVSDVWYRTFVLGELVPHLQESERTQLLHEALQSARRVDDARYRSYALGELALHLPKEVLEAAQDIQNDEFRVGILSKLAPKMPDAILEASKCIREERDQALILEKIAPLKPEKVYHLSKNIKTSKYRLEIIARLVDCLETLSKIELYSLWSDNLLDLRMQRSSDMLEAIAGLFRVVVILSGDTGPSQVLRTVDKTSSWWP